MCGKTVYSNGYILLLLKQKRLIAQICPMMSLQNMLHAKMSYMIKPCPFCGGTNIEVVEGSTFRWRIARCLECGAQAGEIRIQTMGDGSKEEWEAKGYADAIAEWNTRI